MVQPKVSVCVPVYNGEKYIGECIESVLNQTYSDFELIISDNASTDKTTQIVKSFKDARVRYFRNEKNFGISYNYNKCIELSKGEYISFLSSDDLWMPKFLEISVSILDNNKNIDFTHTDEIATDLKGNLLFGEKSTHKYWANNWGFLPAKKGKTNLKKGPHRDIENVILNRIVEINSMLIRKKSLEKVGGFLNYNTYLDWDFTIRCLLNGLKGYYIDEILVNKREHGENVSITTDRLKSLEDIIKIANCFKIDKYKNILLANAYKEMGKSYLFDYGDKFKALKNFLNSIKYQPCSLKLCISLVLPLIPISLARYLISIFRKYRKAIGRQPFV